VWNLSHCLVGTQQRINHSVIIPVCSQCFGSPQVHQFVWRAVQEIYFNYSSHHQCIAYRMTELQFGHCDSTPLPAMYLTALSAAGGSNRWSLAVMTALTTKSPVNSLPFLIRDRFSTALVFQVAGSWTSTSSIVEHRKLCAPTRHRFFAHWWLSVTNTTVLRPFSGTIRVSQCQKKTSGLYGARED